MRSFLRTLLSDFVATFTTLGLSTVVGYLAWRQDVPWYLLAVGVIFAAAGSLFLVNQSREWWATRRIRDDIWLSETISRWLLDAGFTLTKVSDEKRTLNFRVEDSRKRAFGIFRLRTKKDDVRLQFGLELTDEQQTAIGKLEDAEKQRFIEDIHLEMARLGVMYQDVILPSKQIFVETWLPLDKQHFDRFKVLQCALIMIRANVLLTVHIKRAVRAAPSLSTPDTEGYQTE